ncbi:hypothetical protein J6W20_01575 [bacterium]|nr:hypothetical protein [bacterium]
MLIYQKSITLNVNDSNVKLTLNDNNLVNNEITNLGNQALSASVSVSFDNNQTYQTLANSVFANSNFQLAFGTLDSSGKFSAFSTNQVNNANA